MIFRIFRGTKNTNSKLINSKKCLGVKMVLKKTPAKLQQNASFECSAGWFFHTPITEKNGRLSVDAFIRFLDNLKDS